MSQISILELGSATEMVLACSFEILSGKMAIIIIFHQVRVNGGSNYELSWQRWVPKLVLNKVRLLASEIFDMSIKN